MLLTIFVSDSESNEEALQREEVEEDAQGAAEEVQEEQIPESTMKSCCFTSIDFTKYHFDYLPKDSADTYRNYSNNVDSSFQ